MQTIYRPAKYADKDAIINLHVTSWQQHYRGMLEDDFLNVGVWNEKQYEWNERFADPKKNQHILVAERAGKLVGFACVFGNEHPEFGSYLDNLHVSVQRQGVGIALLNLILNWTTTKQNQPKLYLWVLEANKAAIVFYERAGGRLCETQTVEFHGGGPVRACRYVWN